MCAFGDHRPFDGIRQQGCDFRYDHEIVGTIRLTTLGLALGFSAACSSDEGGARGVADAGYSTDYEVGSAHFDSQFGSVLVDMPPAP